MNDNEFWDLVDRYERKDISVNEAVREICNHAKTYEVAMADLELLLKRTITKEEKLLVKEYLNDKNSKRNNRVNSKKVK